MSDIQYKINTRIDVQEAERSFSTLCNTVVKNAAKTTQKIKQGAKEIGEFMSPAFVPGGIKEYDDAVDELAKKIENADSEIQSKAVETKECFKNLFSEMAQGAKTTNDALVRFAASMFELQSVKAFNPESEDIEQMTASTEKFKDEFKSAFVDLVSTSKGNFESLANSIVELRDMKIGSSPLEDMISVQSDLDGIESIKANIAQIEKAIASGATEYQLEIPAQFDIDTAAIIEARNQLAMSNIDIGEVFDVYSLEQNLVEATREIDAIQAKMREVNSTRPNQAVEKELAAEYDAISGRINGVSKALEMINTSEGIMPFAIGIKRELEQIDVQFADLDEELKSAKQIPGMEGKEVVQILQGQKTELAQMQQVLVSYLNQATQIMPQIQGMTSQEMNTWFTQADFEIIKDALLPVLDDAEQKALQVKETLSNVYPQYAGKDSAELQGLSDKRQGSKGMRMQLKESINAMKATISNSDIWQGFISKANAAKNKLAVIVLAMKSLIEKIKNPQQNGQASPNQSNKTQEESKKVAEKSKGHFGKAANSVFSAYSKAFSNLGKPIQSLGNKIKNSITKNLNPANSLLSKFSQKIWTLAKSALIFSVITKALNTVRSGLATSLKDFAKYDSSVNKMLSNFKTSVAGLQNEIVSAFMPALRAIVPILTTLVNYFTAAINVIGKFIAALSGKDTYTSLTTAAQDYTDATNDASSATDDLSKSLAAFDKLNNVTTNDSASNGSGGSSGSTSNANGLQTVNIDSWIKSLAEQAKDGDWTAVGEALSEKFTDVMNNIPWDSISAKSAKLATGIATFLNGFISPDLFSAAASTLANALNTAFIFLDTYGSTFNWANFGESIASGINTFFSTFEFSTITGTISTWANGFGNTISNVLKNTDWAAIGKNLGNGINKLFDDIDFKLAGENVSGMITSAITLADNWVETTDFSQIGEDIADFINGLDWYDIVKSTCDFASDFMKGIGDLLKGAVGNINFAEIANAIADGISDAMMDATLLDNTDMQTWADEHPIQFKISSVISAGSGNGYYDKNGQYVTDAEAQAKTSIEGYFAYVNQCWEDALDGWSWFGNEATPLKTIFDTIAAEADEGSANAYQVLHDWWIDKMGDLSDQIENTVNEILDNAEKLSNGTDSAVDVVVNMLEVYAESGNSFAKKTLESYKSGIVSGEDLVTQALKQFGLDAGDVFTDGVTVNSAGSGKILLDAINLAQNPDYEATLDENKETAGEIADETIDEYNDTISSKKKKTQKTIGGTLEAGRKTAEKEPAKYKKIGQSTIDIYNEGISSKTTTTKKTLQETGKYISKYFANSLTGFDTAGKDSMLKYSKGVSNNKTTVQSNLSLVGSLASTWFTSRLTGFDTAGKDNINKYVSALNGNKTTMQNTLTSIGANASSWFNSRLTGFDTSGKNSIAKYTSGVNSKKTEMQNNLVSIGATSSKYFASKNVGFDIAGKNNILSYRSGVNGQKASMQSTLVSVGSLASTWFKSRLTGFDTAGKNNINSYKSGVNAQKASMQSTLASVGSNAPTWFKSKIGNFANIAKSNLSNYGSGVSNSSNQNSSKNALRNFAGSFEGWIKGKADFGDIAKKMLIGFKTGFSNTTTQNQVKSVMTSWADSIIKSMKKKLGIHSPSKVFAEFGMYSLMGFEKGFDSEEDNTLSQAQSWADQISQIQPTLYISVNDDELQKLNVGNSTMNISAANIPMLSKGGVTTGATLAMIGEAGREAVLPLENNTSWMDTLAGKLNPAEELSLLRQQNSLLREIADKKLSISTKEIFGAVKTENRAEFLKNGKNSLVY